MTTLLIGSFSTLVGDARLLRQIRACAEHYEVTTLGYGPKPEGATRHIAIPEGAYNKIDGRLITLKQYRAAYWTQRGVKEARTLLQGESFDLVLANDLMMLPVLTKVKARLGLHVDLREHFPKLHDDHDKWLKRISPFNVWLLNRYLPQAVSQSTVCEGLATAYEEQFDVPFSIVTNATPFHDLAPTAVTSPIRYVHSGACLRSRHIDLMVDAFRDVSPDKATFDLYLTPNDPAYLEILKAKAEQIPAVTVHDPVPYEELISTLNLYDIGIFLLPPVSFNYRNALPNKFFDYVQARLGILIGPSPEMKKYVNAYDLGVVTKSFDIEELAHTIEHISSDDVMRWKNNSHDNAQSLAGEHGEKQWIASLQLIKEGRQNG